MQESSLLNRLIDYLSKNPSTFLNLNKVQRKLAITESKLVLLLEELEEMKIGKRVFPIKLVNSSFQVLPYSKFYFFDYEKYFRNSKLRPDQQGNLLEQYFFSEISKLNLFEIYTFRTNDNIEIDFILKQNDHFIAIEIKKDQFIYAGDLHHLHTFKKHFNQTIELKVLHNGIRDNYEGIIHICPIDKFIANVNKI